MAIKAYRNEAQGLEYFIKHNNAMHAPAALQKLAI